MSAYVIGTGRHLPDNVRTNLDLSHKLGVDEDWIKQNTGIERRCWADGWEASSDLAVMAIEDAIKSADLQLGDLDYLLAGTMTPDHQVPGIAPMIQAKLGLKQIPCLDIRNACCNALYGFDVAAALVRADRAENVLLVGAEVQSKGLKLESNSKEISAVFGDGAGACVISRTTRPGAIRLIEVSLFTDGRFAKDLAVLAPGTGNGSRWYDWEEHNRSLFYPVMNGKTVILHAARKLEEATRSILDENGWSVQDLDLVIPHQANSNLLLALVRQLRIPKSKMVSVLEWSGNTSSASMLIALDWTYEKRLIRPGSRVLFLAFGAGFAWGAALGIAEP